MADDGITVEIQGLEDLQKALEELVDKAGTQVVRDAVRAGGAVVKQEMVQQAPRDSGLLAEHFSVKTAKQKGEPLAVSAFIGPSAKPVIYPRDDGKTAGMPRSASVIARLLEFGSAVRAKHPFLTAAWETSKTRALDAMIQKLREKLGL